MKCACVAFAVSALILSAASVSAQQATVWEKSYNLSGQPALSLEVSDSYLSVHSCGECRTVHVRIDMENSKLADYNLDESQSGNTVRFSLKEKPHIGIHMNWHNSVKVFVETPANLTLEARSSDGGISAAGLHGDITVTSSDGSQDLDGVSGHLKLRSSDGSLHLRNASGTLEAHSSDGSQDISGTFDTLQVSSSDGSLSVDLLRGSHLSNASTIESRDGSVTMHLPKELALELDISASDGTISSDLPLTLNGYNSKGGSGHTIHGTINGGGPLLTVHSHDGSVRLHAS
jgi:DUF4097 and DUF4098 domain-containing protein YvlB